MGEHRHQRAQETQPEGIPHRQSLGPIHGHHRRQRWLRLFLRNLVSEFRFASSFPRNLSDVCSETREWTLIDLPETDSYKRLSHTATQVGTYIFIQGGHDGAEYTSDIKCFSLGTYLCHPRTTLSDNVSVNLQYENRPVCGKPPSQRGYHVCLLADSRLFFFGGYNGMTAFDEVHLLDLAGSAFLPQVTSFEIDL